MVCITNKRKVLLEKIENSLKDNCDEKIITLNLTSSELLLIKLGVKMLDQFESIIEDELNN